MEDDPDYEEQSKQLIKEELLQMNDFELHLLCTEKTVLRSFRLTKEQLFESSGKLICLKEMINELICKKHRILLFSQMTKVMSIIQYYLEEAKIKYLRLDGNTPVEERQELIDKYNEDTTISIFLLSTKAGGVGINLYTADTVIFYDLSYNYQVDKQAEDRCHRINNKNNEVNVIKILTEDSVEEKIFKLAKEKRDLSDFILEEGNFDSKNYNKAKSDTLLNLLKKMWQDIK